MPTNIKVKQLWLKIICNSQDIALTLKIDWWWHSELKTSLQRMKNKEFKVSLPKNS